MFRVVITLIDVTIKTNAFLMNLLIDKEVNLSQTDLLQTRPYAEGLKSLILNARVGVPLTIGLFGKWGSGKSSIIRTLIEDEDIINDKERKIISKFVLYDAWKYTNDSFRRTFLSELQTSLKVEPTSVMKNFYAAQSREIAITRKFNIPFLFFTVVTFGMAAYTFRSIGLDRTAEHTLLVLISMLSLVGTIISKFFYEFKQSEQYPVVFAAEQFESCFNEILSIALGKTKFSRSFFEKLRKKEVQPTFQRIIIVIDNIDRCSRELAHDMLSNTKNFLDSKLDVIFLIPVDDDALKKHLFKQSGSAGGEAEEFLRKYFNTILRIKKFKTSEIFDFADNINRQHELGFQPDTINIIAREYASNPRRIIQFFNNLRLEIETLEVKYNEQFVLDNEVAICKYLIIREEWPEKYAELCINPEAFSLEDPNTFNSNSKFLPESFEAFMESTYVSTRYLDSITLQKILINSDNYITLPEEILTALQEENREKYEECLASNDYTSLKVQTHLLFALDKSVKKGLFGTDTSESMHMLVTSILLAKDASKAVLTRLQEITRRQIVNILSGLKSFDRLIRASNLVLINNFSYLDEEIEKYCLDFKHQDGRFYDNQHFQIYQAYIRNANLEQLTRARPAFWNYLSNPKLNNKLDQKIPDAHLEVLYDAQTIGAYLIDNEKLPWEDYTNFNNWMHLATVFSNSNQLLKPLLNAVGTTLEKNLQSARDYIKTFGVLFVSIQHIEAGQDTIEQLHRINDAVFIKKRFPKVGEHASFMQGLHSNDIPDLIEYLLQSYRITYCSGSTAGWIEEFIRIHGLKRIEKSLLKFITKYKASLDFSSLKFLLVNLDLLSDSTIEIVNQLLFIRHMGIYIYSDVELEDNLMGFLEKSKTEKRSVKLVVKLAKNRRMKKIISSLKRKISEESMLEFDPIVKNLLTL